jgi:hypothetical protein
MSQKRHIGIFDRSGDPKSAITTLACDYPMATSYPCISTIEINSSMLRAGYEGSHWKRNVGGSSAPCCMDSERDSAHDHNVRFGSDEIPVSKAKARKILPRDCCVINVSTFLKELILHACTLRRLRKSVKWHMHLVAIILHQSEAVQMVPLQLPHLSDPRLIRISDLVTKDPSDSRPLAELCRLSGTSKRSIERLFQ